MNFDDTPEEAAFRAEVRAWIDANAPKALLGPLMTSGFGNLNLAGADPMEAAKIVVSDEVALLWAASWNSVASPRSPSRRQGS